MKIFIVGINGKMGKFVAARAESQGYSVAGGIDVFVGGKYPVFKTAEEVNVEFDVIIDFSRPETLGQIFKLCEIFKKPVVLATTGHSAEQLAEIKKLSQSVAVFKTANMSLGVNAVTGAVKLLTAVLAGYDIEIVEAHHNQKVDAPSGTAKLLLSAVEEVTGGGHKIIGGREGNSLREKGEIGMHAIRGGTIVGEHTVMYIGDDEIIEIKHTALSRNVFAVGAVDAAAFICDKKAGLYDMNDLIVAKNT